MKQDPYVDALLRRAERTGTKRQLETSVRGLEDLIEASLRSALVSRNEKFNTATGNAYQTVRLRTTEIEGFRSARDHVFSGIELNGKIVHDYGSNLGEVSRAAARRGAHFARSFESGLRVHSQIDQCCTTKYGPFWPTSRIQGCTRNRRM